MGHRFPSHGYRQINVFPLGSLVLDPSWLETNTEDQGQEFLTTIAGQVAGGFVGPLPTWPRDEQFVNKTRQLLTDPLSAVAAGELLGGMPDLLIGTGPGHLWPHPIGVVLENAALSVGSDG
jgi:hypothetical protein